MNRFWRRFLKRQDGFAKVDVPLMSLGARGKIGDAVVFFPWKGRNVVRQWLKPTQPNSVLQGYVRSVVFAIGKAIAKILSVSAGDAVNSQLYEYLTAKMPAGQIWNAFHAKGFLNLLVAANAFVTGSWTAMVAEYSALNTTDLAAWASEATGLGLVDFAFGYGYTDNIPAGLQLYVDGKAAVANSIHTASPYNTAAESWVVADITSFAIDHTT